LFVDRRFVVADDDDLGWGGEDCKEGGEDRERDGEMEKCILMFD
jgi:hypothetical protein